MISVVLKEKIEKLQGPILVLGGSGFIGANLTLQLLAVRKDVVSTASRLPAWRLSRVPEENVREVDLLVPSNLDSLLKEVRPRTVFNCVAYGAYSFEKDSDLIYRTNFLLTVNLVEKLADRGIACYVHAGSSSEYGDLASAPSELAPTLPNSDYAVSKLSSANLLSYYGKKKAFPCANLRLYSAYGPYEDSARFIPALIRHGLEGEYPPLVRPDISRDFVYIDDVCAAFFDTANNLRPEDYGESFNIGTGQKVTIEEAALTAAGAFGVTEPPVFSMPARDWDVSDWYADPTRAKERLGWESKTGFAEGFRESVEWYRALEDKERYHSSSKQYEMDTKHSVTAIVACYKDGQAIPIMYERLRKTFEKIKVDYEIIFVNDNSPDSSEEVIRSISRHDRRVIGITHSRNFGSQSAFRSGMEIATKNSCVLLDGDLQDPPELIEQFVERWREGYDVVYGTRTKREAPVLMQIAYKLFYILFDNFSYLSIPHDAGDFSLMDRRVVENILAFPERDLFLRGVRAFVGFNQIGVPYVRPERMFGRTTNSLGKNIGWAKKGILSFSNAPLSVLSFTATLLLFITFAAGIVQLVLRLFYPYLAPKGFTTLILIILFFGSIIMFSLAIVGEYIAKIFEEVKQRPHYIRKSLIRDGEVRPAAHPRTPIVP